MFKISSTEMIRIVKTLEKSAFAINVLERNNQNKMIFGETKKDLHKLIDDLKSRYGLEQFDEWKKKK